ncbi:MAG: SpoIIE family protein phosphatase, partial [Oscillospiraceae bacterium]|nr:SpoIIE family protein phosphatase [Oscillospiraceae bacterium]
QANLGFFAVRERSWYTGAKTANELTWSSLVDDSYGRGLGIVCTDPIFDNNGSFFGVAGVSMLLSELSDTISNEELGETSYAFAIDSEGNTVIMPGMTSLSQSINLLTDANEQSVKDMAQKMINGESGVAQVTLYGKEVYAAYTPLNSINWSICTVIGVDEILRPALLNDEEISKYTSLAVREIDNAIFFMMIIIVVIIAASLIVITILASTFSKKLTEPIVKLTDMAQKIGEGDLTCKAEIKTGDEIEVLSDTLDTMTEQLSGYIDNITQITAEKERMGAELDIAAKIQESELPRKFPAFPDRQEFDIHALMTPAKEVGGDFYDFFLVDKDHLAVVIADVSGKGIPAAMFMMSAKTHIKTNASIGKSPSDILSATNDELCSGNDAEMFVTAFVGILELSTGRFVYANAGHNPPLLKRGNGKYEWLKIRPGFVLAGMPGIRYRQAELYFGKDDMLFMYTDGVTEAADVNEKLFGNDRLEQALNEHLDASPKQIVGKILKKIVKFEEGADQADDITMVALQYFSPQKKDQYEINLPAEKPQLQLLLDKVDALLEQHDCNPKAQYQVDVCIEEIFVNIASYAYGGKPGPARVTCEFENAEDGGEQIIITFCDDGVPYNPLNREAPDITLDAEEREIGGLGIFMTQKMMDKTEYEYKGENIFRMYKKIN